MTDARFPDRSALSGWRKLLYQALPLPVQAVERVRMPAKRVLVFTKGRNPTFDYYLETRLARTGLPFEIVDIDGRDRSPDIDPLGTFVVICRYLAPRHMLWIRKNQKRLSGVAYFVDDDLRAVLAESGAEIGYRFYLAFFGLLPIFGLRGVLTDVWASTPALEQALRSQRCRPVLLPPAPAQPASHRGRSPGAPKIAFHASSLHFREHEFIVKVVERVAQFRPAATFEVVARARNARFWSESSLPPERLEIVPPMDWDRYQARSVVEGADIALVPLLDCVANLSRSDTKVIDCVRLGAAPIMSDVPAYRRAAELGIPAVPNSMDKWIEMMLMLIDNPKQRDDARAASRLVVSGMVEQGSRPLPGVESLARAEEP